MDRLSDAPGSAPAPAPSPDRPRERLLAAGPRALSDADLLALLIGTGTGKLSARAAALSLLEAVPLPELAWAPPDAIAAWPGVGTARAAAIAAAFELGRRGAWSPPHAQCPVSPRDALRPAVREGAHGVVFCHNHPSGDPTPSPDDVDLTERLRAAAELVGVLARDHVIVAAGGYFSFVEAGRWRR
jgi:DNA repair protein RadC